MDNRTLGQLILGFGTKLLAGAAALWIATQAFTALHNFVAPLSRALGAN